MSLPLVFQAGVRDEIDETYNWYETRDRGLGEEFLAEVDLVLERIVQSPELPAPIYQDVRHVRIKRFPYAVYYRIEAARIVVIAVHHGKRNPMGWRSRAK
jgi:plasmid stabilization system protein ParE